MTAQRNHAVELAAGIAEQRAEIQASASKFRHDQLDELGRDTQQITQSGDDETKARTRQALLSLAAPGRAPFSSYRCTRSAAWSPPPNP